MSPSFSYGQQELQDTLILIPSLGYSDDLGVGLGANGLWAGVLGSSFTGQGDFQYANTAGQSLVNVNVFTKRLLDVLYFELGVGYQKSRNARFYGIGNESNFNDPSYYAFEDSNYYGRIGFGLFDLVTLGVGYSRRQIGLTRSQRPDDPQFFDRFLDHPRPSGLNTTYLEFFMMIDTRNNIYLPTDGFYLFSSVNQTQSRTGEDFGQQRILADARYYLPFWSGDMILASRLRYEREWGENVPFYAQTRIGGQDTFRAWRTNRYVDAGSTVLNVEARFKGFAVGSAITRIEPSIGLDFGRVFDTRTFPPIPPFENYRRGWSLGLTAVTASNIPVRFDYAWADEGALFYLHLLQPF
ncbi:MAG: BamA/TamA family outer membrane protein [Oligoflexia bacterium]|nr:BamA/TamA family outer membrane protein [Oligoflexia bacterium]